jgi:hypothetical protein
MTSKKCLEISQLQIECEFIDENGGVAPGRAATKEALGIAISDNLLSLADEVIV